MVRIGILQIKCLLNIYKNNMRKYLIFYYVEKNDDCHDLEMIIEADSIEEAIKLFKSRVRVMKRITTVTELPNT